MDKKGWKELRRKENTVANAIGSVVFGTILLTGGAATTLLFNLHYYKKTRMVQAPNTADATMITEPSKLIFEIRDTLHPMNEEIEQAMVQKELIQAYMAANEEEEKQRKKEKKNKKKGGWT